MKKIVLTWGAWFIWSHLLKSLILNKYHIFCLIKKTSDLHRIENLMNNENVELIDSDNIWDIEQIFIKNKIDYIIHLATLYKKTHEINDINNMIDTNIKLWTYLSQFAIKYWTKYFINTWTFFEYRHHQDKENILSENSEEFPFNLYASTKLSFNNILRYYTDTSKLKAITLRLFSPYWPNDNIKIIPLFIKNIIEGWREELKLSGWEQKLCFTYIDDIVNAYLKCLENIEDLWNNYEVFNIWSNEIYSLKEIYGYLCDISGKKWNVRFWAFPYASNEIFYSKCDNLKAKELLCREPTTPITDWLFLTYNSYKDDFWKN